MSKGENSFGGLEKKKRNFKRSFQESSFQENDYDVHHKFPYISYKRTFQGQEGRVLLQSSGKDLLGGRSLCELEDQGDQTMTNISK